MKTALLAVAIIVAALPAFAQQPTRERVTPDGDVITDSMTPESFKHLSAQTRHDLILSYIIDLYLLQSCGVDPYVNDAPTVHQRWQQEAAITFTLDPAMTSSVRREFQTLVSKAGEARACKVLDHTARR
jgi:hypothetical protein